MTTNEQTSDQTGPDRWSRLHNQTALIPWAAGLAAAGYYQADLAVQTLGWTYPWALAFPLAIECGIAWSAGNYYRRLVNRDSAIGARLGFYSLLAFSCGLLFWHARTEGRPIASAIAISALSLIAAWVWTQRSGLQRRDVMRARGLIYPSMPNYPVYRWILCPRETWSAMRYGVKHAISDPIEALDTYRTARQAETDRKSADREAAAIRPRPGKPDPQTRPVQQTVQIPDPTKSKTAVQTPDRKQTPTSRPTDQTSIDELVYMSAIREHPDWPQTTLNQIADLVAGIDPIGTCGRSRAIRLRDKALDKEGATQ